MGLLTPPNDWGDEQLPVRPAHLHAYLPRQLAGGRASGSIRSASTTPTSMPATRRPISSTTRSRRTAPRPMPTPAPAPMCRSRRAAQLQFAGGVQGATDIAGRAVTLNGFRNGQLAYFLAAQWTPSFLAGGTYGVLYYSQPSVPLQPSASQGVSFSAVQNINDDDTGCSCASTTPRATPSRSRPRSRSAASSTIRSAATGSTRPGSASPGTRPTRPPSAARRADAEWVAELYYSYTIFKALAGHARPPGLRQPCARADHQPRRRVLAAHHVQILIPGNAGSRDGDHPRSPFIRPQPHPAASTRSKSAAAPLAGRCRAGTRHRAGRHPGHARAGTP